MSNKTQLQTNNTNLDALITRVNAAKDTAASLPEVGGATGGASVISGRIVWASTAEPMDGDRYVYYTNELGQATSLYLEEEKEITTIANSIVFLGDYFEMDECINCADYNGDILDDGYIGSLDIIKRKIIRPVSDGFVIAVTD